MTSHITLWGRNDDASSLDAMRFLKRYGFAADRLLDLDLQPPTAEEWAAIGTDPSHASAPILLTPKGALVGFRERQWMRFLEIDKRHEV